MKPGMFEDAWTATLVLGGASACGALALLVVALTLYDRGLARHDTERLRERQEHIKHTRGR